MRATRVSGCGEPVLGPDSVISTEGFISVAMTANIVAGEALSVTNASGRICVQDTPTPKFLNYSLEISFCGVNPELITMLTGQPVVLNADGDAVVGFRMNSQIDVDLVGFALELWSSVPVAVCDDTGSASYGYILLPFIKGGTLGDFTVENGVVNFTLSGAATKDGSGWGVGPYNVVRDASDIAAPLVSAITEGDHMNLEITTVAPPSVASDTATALGVPATLITAGIPATLTPANSYTPKNLADLLVVLPPKSPTSAWTAGQYVRLRDGSTAHWTSSTWAAGPA